MQLFYSTAQVALMLGVSARRIRQRIKEGRYPNAFRGDELSPWFIPIWDIYQTIPRGQRYLTTYEVAEREGIKENSVRWRVVYGLIPGAQKCGHYWLIPENYAME